MAVVKSISPGSAFKVGLVVYAFLGLIVGLVAAFFSMIAGSLGGLAGHNTAAAHALGLGFGVGSIIFFPIVYGILGGILGAMSALFYNIAAGWVGGLEVEVDR